MQILDIVLYGDNNRVRQLSLRPGRLNIITGASKTGKSALSNIVEYCLDRDSFLVPAGVITNHVRWYGLRLQFPSTQVFIARRAPERGEHTGTAVYLAVGAELALPTTTDLKKNMNSKDMREKLSRLLHVSPNLNIPDEGETRIPLEATLSQALLLNFQQQGEVANQYLLFHRQGEPFMPQTIKDTLPYFLGAVAEGRLAKVQELRRARRELARAEKRKQEADSLHGEGLSKGMLLLTEAEGAGLLAPGSQPTDIGSLREALLPALNWKPTELPAVPGDTLTRLQEERNILLNDYRRLKESIKAAKNCAEGQTRFAFEAREQQARLHSISLYQEPTADASICPVCQSTLESPLPAAADLQGALEKIVAQLNTVVAESPRLREQIDRMEDELREVGRKLDVNRHTASTIAAQQPNVSEMIHANARVSMVVGKVDYYLEYLPNADKPTVLEEEVVQMRQRVEDLEEELDNTSTEELLPSILNNIGKRIETYATQLALEYRTSPLRLDMTNLTVIADADSGPVPLARMGSGANWLGYHLATHVALHDWFIQKARPVPRFLFLDQPSQAYYPQDWDSEGVLAALKNDPDGSLGFLEDDDRVAVRRVFHWLYDTAEAFTPNFQIIVTDHADIEASWFQESVIARWRGDDKLIPLSWQQ